MEILKNAVVVISFIFGKIGAMRAWAAVSYMRIFVLFVPVVLFLNCGAYVALNYPRFAKIDENRAKKNQLIVEENGYIYALDEITACLDSAKNVPQLSAWYCERAVMQYRNVSLNWPQGRVGEVIDKHAYLAMKNDINHYLRSVKLERAMNPAVSWQEEAREWLVTDSLVKDAVMFIFWVAVSSGVFVLFRGMWQNHKRIPRYCLTAHRTMRDKTASRRLLQIRSK